MKSTLLASVTLLGLAATQAQGAQVAAWGQISATNTIVATNPAPGFTEIMANDALVNVTQLLDNPVFNGVFFNLDATSTDAAVPVGGALVQHYGGSFCISVSNHCAGTILLTGGFTDAVFGASGGPGLVLNVNSPPDSLTLGSQVIPASELTASGSLRSFGLAFTNLSPVLALNGTTIAPFTASFAGTASDTSPAPEPAGIALLGVGLLGLGLVRHRQRR
jgi:hypothetical protein